MQLSLTEQAPLAIVIACSAWITAYPAMTQIWCKTELGKCGRQLRGRLFLGQCRFRSIGCG